MRPHPPLDTLWGVGRRRRLQTNCAKEPRRPFGVPRMRAWGQWHPSWAGCVACRAVAWGRGL
eukprot:10264478-Alexandrium_andersonii.AAC.1